MAEWPDGVFIGRMVLALDNRKLWLRMAAAVLLMLASPLVPVRLNTAEFAFS